jgi:hypothetical protein
LLHPFLHEEKGEALVQQQEEMAGYENNSSFSSVHKNRILREGELVGGIMDAY